MLAKARRGRARGRRHRAAIARNAQADERREVPLLRPHGSNVVHHSLSGFAVFRVVL